MGRGIWDREWGRWVVEAWDGTWVEGRGLGRDMG